MMTELPGDCRWRRPTLVDAEAIFGLVAERNTALVGFPDVTLDDVRDELTEPGFDPGVDGWLVVDGSGAVTGYGWTMGKGASDLVDIDVIARDDVVAEWLWAQVLARAAAVGRRGNGTVRVDIGIYQADEGKQARARDHGFIPATTYQRMRIDFDQPPLEPVVPRDVVVRTGPGDETLRRDGHGVWRRAFADHFGFVERSFDEWHEGIEASASHDWAQLRVAYLDGRPVAMLLGSDQFVEDENCGYVASVAVLGAARGRGLAKLLLRQTFVADARRGRRGTILHVDANNTTPAVDLYVNVGMRPVLAIDVWRLHAQTA